jgi:hypothetical protein
VSDPRIAGSARTVFGSLGGELGDVPARELARIAAAAALDADPAGAGEIDQVPGV